MTTRGRRPPPKGEVERVMAMFDANEDGRVTWDEFRAELLALKAKPKSGAASGAVEHSSCSCRDCRCLPSFVPDLPPTMCML